MKPCADRASVRMRVHMHCTRKTARSHTALSIQRHAEVRGGCGSSHVADFYSTCLVWMNEWRNGPENKAVKHPRRTQSAWQPLSTTREREGTRAVFPASRPTGLRGRNMKHAVDAGRGASSPDSSPLSRFSRC
ncbi:hypothetical protein AOLI_G00301070 [Acnodon oligacanthus]